MQLPVSLKLQPSRRLALLLFTVHGGALAVISSTAMPGWIKLAVLLGILWSAWHVREGLQGQQRIVRLMLRRDGLLDYSRSNGVAGEARIHPHTTVTPWLTVVLLRSARRIEPLVLLADSLDAEDFRQLRLWLRWQAVLD